MRLTDGLLAPLEIALNRYLAEDPEALVELAAYEGRVLALQLRELGFSAYLRPHAAGFQVLGETVEPVAATVTTSLPVLARLALSDDKGRSLVLSGEIAIDGDNEFAQSLLNVLREADVDPEEWLSQRIGDVPAYRVGQLLRGLFGRGQQTAEQLGRDTVNFLRDDRRELVARSETREWMDQVDALRSDVDRMEARIKRLLARTEAAQ